MSRNERERKGSQDPLLLPALDKPGGGVQWGSVAKLVNLVKEGSTISKHLRHALRTRLTCGEEYRVLNTLTVLHTISLNGSLEVRKQLADTKLLKLLERVHGSFPDTGFTAMAISQILVDWAFLFGDEDLGQKGARLMKHLRSVGAPALRHSQVAAERWEERELGIPIMHFVHGVDFGAPNTPTSGDDFAGGSQRQEGETLQNKQPKLAKWRKLFSKRGPGTPCRLRGGASSQQLQQQKTNGQTPSWVDDLLARMPVDAGDLNEVVKSIRVLKENGGSESDIAGMIAATKPLAEKVETWGGQALELLASQVDNITAGVESKEGHGTTKQAGIVLESEKLTKLLKTSDTVQDIVAAWAQLQRDVENGSSSIVHSPLDRRRETKHETGTSQSSSIASPDGMYPDRESPEPMMDYGDDPVSSTPSWAGPLGPKLPDFQLSSPYSSDLDLGAFHVGEESYSPVRLRPMKYEDPSSFPAPVRRPRPGRKSQRHVGTPKLSKAGREVGIIHSFDSDRYPPAGDAIAPGFNSEPFLPGMPKAWNTPLEDLSLLWTEMGDTGRENVQSEDMGRHSKNPFRRDPNAELSGPTQSPSGRTSIDEAVPSSRAGAVQAKFLQGKGPFQDPGMGGAEGMCRRSPLATDTSSTTQRNSPIARGPVPPVLMFPDSPRQSETRRLPEGSSLSAEIHAEDTETGANPFRNKGFPSSLDGRPSFEDINLRDDCDRIDQRTSTPPAERRNVDQGIVTTNANPFHKQEAGRGLSRNPFVSQAEEAKTRPKGVEEDLQAPLKVSDSVSPQPSGPFKLTRKNIHMRRSHKKERKPRFSLNHASPFRDFKNKIPSPEGLPPKVQALKRGSLDMLRGGPQRTIPALRVRFTPEHLKEVVERMGESKDKEF